MSIARRGAIASSSSGGIAPGAGQIILATRVNYGNPSNEAQTAISGWGGNPSASIVHEYLNVASTWGTWPSSGVWSATGGFSPGFTGFPGARAISIPMQTTGAPLTWTDVTGGGQDTNWTSYFEWCVTNQVVYQRPGWEGNLSSSTWPWATLGNDTTANQAGYVATWQHIWSLAHAVAPGYFKFIWCPDFPAGGSNMTTWEPGGAYYPGDSFVDFIGLDAYNTWAGGGSFPGDAAMLTALESGNAPNWNQTLAYAKAHSKGICLYEWGMNGDGSLPNGGDDPTWINNVSGLMVTAAQSDGLTVIAGVWDNAGASPISGYPNANTAVGTNVANWVSLGLTVGPASLTVNAVPTQAGVVGTAYSYTFGATGGTTPYTWTWTGEPAGLTLASNGVVSGTPTTVESTTVTVYATDAASHTAHTSYTFGVTASGGLVPNAPTTINGVTVPTTIVFHDEFTGPHLDTTKWLPGYYYDNAPGGGAFGSCNTIKQSNLSIDSNGLELAMPGEGSVSCVTTMPWANSGPWTNQPSLGITNPITDFTGFSISPTGGGVGSGTGAFYMEVKGTPTAAGGGVANWLAFWLVVNLSEGYSNFVAEIDLVETAQGTGTYGADSHVHFGPTGGEEGDGYYWANFRPAGFGDAVGGEAHTYGVMVTSDWVAFVIDGVVNPDLGGTPSGGAGLVKASAPDTWQEKLGAGSVMTINGGGIGTYSWEPFGIILTNTNHCGSGNSFPSTVPVEYCRVWQG